LAGWITEKTHLSVHKLTGILNDRNTECQFIVSRCHFVVELGAMVWLSTF